MIQKKINCQEYIQVLYIPMWHIRGNVNAIIIMFVCLRLNIPVNNFSVILGWLSGFNQY